MQQSKIPWGNALVRPLAAAAATLALAGAPGIAQASNLLSNSGFEATNLGTGNYDYYHATVDSWTYLNDAVLINATDPSPGGSAWWPSDPAPSGFGGVQFAGVQDTGSLSQAFTVSTSGSYALSWLAGGRPVSYGGCCNGDQTYEIEIDGIPVGSPFSTTSGEAFTAESLNLTGLTAGGHTLTFQGLVSHDETAFIDDVSLSAVPEPAAWALMLVGFGGLGWAVRARRERASIAV